MTTTGVRSSEISYDATSHQPSVRRRWGRREWGRSGDELCIPKLCALGVHRV